MEKVTVKCKTAVYGNVRAELLWANEPMSFWELWTLRAD